MKPELENHEGPEAQDKLNICPKCGKDMATPAGDSVRSADLSLDQVCGCAAEPAGSQADEKSTGNDTSKGRQSNKDSENSSTAIEHNRDDDNSSTAIERNRDDDNSSTAIEHNRDDDNSSAESEQNRDDDNSKTQKVVFEPNPAPSQIRSNMPGKLRKLRRTHEGITFTRLDTSKASSGIIGLMDGAIIGGIYRIIRRIGRGAMGEVYLAEHIMLGKNCALKVIAPDQLTDVSWLRFQTEAKAVAMLDHSNLVKVSHLGIHEGCLPYYVMDYFEGETLEELLFDQKTLPLNTALEIFIQLCDGLDYAHRHSIVHRDLKPANIMLLAGPIGKDSVKVLDFGLAKLTHQDKDKHSRHLTSVGEIFGSPPYMSPEQCRGDKIDNRSDIYSLGCTLFECLTGRTPFVGSLATTLLYNHQKTEPPSLESAMGAKHFPEEMEEVMARLLRKDPTERYQSMAALHNDLEQISRDENISPYQRRRSPEGASELSGSRAKIVKGEDFASGEGNREVVARTMGAVKPATSTVAAGEEDADSWTTYKPPKVVWVLAGIFLIGLVGAYWFYAQHQEARIAVTPVLNLDGPPPSVKETTPFSSIVEDNGQRYRRFNFPVDISLGQIHSASNLVIVPAMGQRQFPDKAPIYFSPNTILAKYPGYLARFRPGDIYAVTIANVVNSDSLLKAASIIPQVEELTVYRCKFLTSEGLKCIQNFENLEDLDLSYNNVDISCISNVPRLKEFRTLRLSGENNIYPVIKAIEHSDRIKELYLDDCSISPQLLTIIASLPNLTTLSLNSDNLTDQDLTTLSKSACLHFLSILKTPITQETARIIRSFPSLKVLKIIARPNGNAESNRQLLDLRTSLPALKVY